MLYKWFVSLAWVFAIGGISACTLAASDTEMQTLLDGAQKSAAAHKYEAALTQLDKVCEANHSSDPLLQRAILLVAIGRYSNAFVDYEKAVAAEPNNSNCYANRGWAYFTTGQTPKALADLNQALKLDPKDVNALRERAVVNHAAGNADASLADYSAIIALAPSDTAAYEARGMAYAAKAQHDAGIADFNKAIELSPKMPRLYAARAASLAATKKYTEALVDADRSVQLGENESIFRIGRANLLLAAGKPDAAQADVDAALAADPHDVSAFNARAAVEMANHQDAKAAITRGWALYYSRQYDKAQVEFDRAIATDANSADAHCGRGAALLWQYTSASQTPRAGVRDEQQRDNATVKKERAAYSKRKQALKASLASLDHAFELDPKSGRTCQYLTLANMFSSNYEAAADSADKAIELQPNSSQAYLFRGAYRFLQGTRKMLNRMGEPYTSQSAITAKVAIDDLSKAIALDPNNADAYFLRAKCYELMDKTELALRDLDHAITKAPSFSEISFLCDFPNDIMLPRDHAKMLLERSPIAAIQLQRAVYYNDLNQYEPSLDAVDQAIAIFPYDAQLFSMRAGCHVNAKRFDKAVADMKRANQLSPSTDYVDALAEIGWEKSHPNGNLTDGERLIIGIGVVAVGITAVALLHDLHHGTSPTPANSAAQWGWICPRCGGTGTCYVQGALGLPVLANCPDCNMFGTR